MSQSGKRAGKGREVQSSAGGQSSDAVVAQTAKRKVGRGRAGAARVDSAGMDALPGLSKNEKRPGSERRARRESAGNGSRTQPERRGPGRPGGLDPDETRSRILAAARDLFANRGYGEVGLREIGKAVGVNPATIHYHFGSKEELYRRVVEGAAAVMLQRMTAAASGGRPAVERLTDAIQTYGAVLSDHPYLPRILFRHAMSEPLPLPDWFVKEYAAKVKALLPAILHDGIVGGEFRPLDPRFTFIAVMSLCFFFHLGFPVFRQILGAAPQELGESAKSGLSFPSPSAELTQEYSQHILDLLLRGIRAEPAKE